MMGNVYRYNAKQKHTQCNYVETKHKPTKLSKRNAKAIQRVDEFMSKHKCNQATKMMKQKMQTQCSSSLKKTTNTKNCHKTKIKMQQK